MRRGISEEKGFTLIELLVVLIVVGFLAVIAVPLFLAQSERTHVALVKSDVRNAVLADTVRGTSGAALPPGTYSAGDDLGDAENSFRVSGGVVIVVTATKITGTHGELSGASTWSYDRTAGKYQGTGAFE